MSKSLIAFCVGAALLAALPSAYSAEPAGTPPRVTVKKGMANGNTFLPGKDRFTGTMTDNGVWAISHNYKGSTYVSRITLAKAEGGEDTVPYDAALSRISGSFTQTKDDKGAVVDIPKSCTITGMTISTIWASNRALAKPTLCPLDPGQQYFFNIRVSGAQGCGAGGKQCRILSFSNLPE